MSLRDPKIKPMTTGSHSTCLGYQAPYNLTTGTTNIAIGYDVFDLEKEDAYKEHLDSVLKEVSLMPDTELSYQLMNLLQNYRALRCQTY